MHIVPSHVRSILAHKQTDDIRVSVGLSTSAKMDVPRDFAKATPIAFFESYPTLKQQPLHIPVDFQASLRHTPCFRRQPIDTLPSFAIMSSNLSAVSLDPRATRSKQSSFQQVGS